jgi:hypothetical protein
MNLDNYLDTTYVIFILIVYKKIYFMCSNMYLRWAVNIPVDIYEPFATKKIDVNFRYLKYCQRQHVIRAGQRKDTEAQSPFP